MGRKVVFLGVVAAGLVQVAPLSAQMQDVPVQDRAQDQDAASAQAPVDSPEAPVDAPRAVAAAPAAAAPDEVRDRARELAERDLATVPPEERKPVLIDPAEARRARARAAEAEARDVAAPRPAMAEAPESAPPARAPRPVYAEDDREPGYLDEHDAGRDRRGDPGADSTIYADRASIPAPVDREPAVEDASTARDMRGRQARQAEADDAAAAVPPPARDLRERQARRVYAEDGAESEADRAGAPLARDLPARASRPVYADDARDGRAAYPEDRDDTAADIDDRGLRPGERYAIVDRGLRPDVRYDDAPRAAWGNRATDPGCDGERAARLRDNVRRKADFERIDSRVAEDLEEEIGHAANLQRSYCATGMNDWRGQRLARLYAQIEDRIRYEEDRRWQR